MTRVNVVPAKILLDQHLRAELREIPRIITQSRKTNCSPVFLLGTGHVTFFYNKLNFIFKRILELDLECKLRGFKGLSDNYINVLRQTAINKSELNNDYLPTNKAIELSKQRIIERINLKPYWYKMKSIDLNESTYKQYIINLNKY